MKPSIACLICIPLLTMSVGCVRPASVVSTAARGPQLVAALSRPAERDAAYCELLRLRLHRRGVKLYPETCAPVTAIVHAPQPSGPPITMVFTDPGYALERGPTRRGPVGPYSLFEADGTIVPVFAAANMVMDDSELFDYAPHGVNAVGHAFGYSAGDAFGPDGFSVEVLNIVPTTPRQRPALSVIMGPPSFGFEDSCLGDFWSWRYLDVDGDGWPEIEVGPHLDASGAIAPAATFRWSAKDSRYLGPAGSAAEGFLVYDTTDCDEIQRIHARFAAYWRTRQGERQGHRVSRCSSSRELAPLEPIPN
jgi:hypothetical protein